MTCTKYPITRSFENRMPAEYRIDLLDTLSDDDWAQLMRIADGYGRRRRDDRSGFYQWIAYLAGRVLAQRADEQLEATSHEMPRPLYVSPAALGGSIVACQLIIKTVDTNAQATFMHEVLTDLVHFNWHYLSNMQEIHDET